MDSIPSLLCKDGIWCDKHISIAQSPHVTTSENLAILLVHRETAPQGPGLAKAGPRVPPLLSHSS